MRARNILIPAILALGATALAGADEIAWKKDYAAGLRDAKSSGKLVMLDFFTEW